MQVVILIAVQKGFTDGIQADQLQAYFTGAIKVVSAAAFVALQELGATKILTAATELKITEALKAYNAGVWK